MEPRGVGRPTPAASTSRSCGSLSGAPGGWRGSARRSRSISKRPCYGVPGAGSKRSSRRGRGSYRLATTGGPDSSGPRRRRRGGWTAPVTRMLGIRLPVVGSVLQVVVTKSRPAVLPQLVQPIARRLTLKQDDGRDLPDRRRLAGRVRSADPVRHHAPRPHRPQRLGRRANRTRARGDCAWSGRGRQHGRLAADPRGGGGPRASSCCLPVSASNSGRSAPACSPSTSGPVSRRSRLRLSAPSGSHRDRAERNPMPPPGTSTRMPS